MFQQTQQEIPKSKLIHKLIGDKGYIVNILKRKRKIKNVKFDIITPFRKNQTTKNNERDKKLLQGRYKIEHLFCRLKKLVRLYLRKDRSLKCYKSFFYLGMILTTLENW